MKRCFLQLLLLCFSLSVAAQTFYVDKFKYRVTDKEAMTVELLAAPLLCKGACVVPSQVKYDGVKYDVTAIGGSAFKCCKNLEAVELPTSVKEIGSWAFLDCVKLVKVAMPEGLERIGYSAFRNCQRLNLVIIPATVTVVDAWAFAGCSSLLEVVLKSDRLAVNNGSFDNCPFLQVVSVRSAVPPQISADVFDKRALAGARLLVPAGACEAYRAAPGWCAFAEVQECVEE